MTNKTAGLKFLVCDFRFWIFIYFAVRLFGITNAPLEVAHNWRQVTGNMVARNFLETDANIFFPRVDMAGEKTGITGTEFPLFNYLIYLVSFVFGYAHWYGRLINLIVSSFGIWYFYILIRKFLDPKIAFYSGIILLNSIWFAYSRKIMPDTFSLSLVIAGMYYGLSFLTEGKTYRLILFLLLTLAGCLSKIPAAVILPVFLLPVISKAILLKRKILLVSASLVIAICSAAWYLYWVPYLDVHFGYWHYYMGTSFSAGFSELLSHPWLTADKFWFDALKISGFFVFLAGIFMAFRNRNKLLTYIFILTSISFLLFMVKAGRTFYSHGYYIIPYSVVMALMAGYAVSMIKKKMLRNLLLFFLIADGIANQYNDFLVKKSERYKPGVEAIADRTIEKKALIVINGGDDPQDIYFTHHKGWSLDKAGNYSPALLDSLRFKGGKYLFINKNNTEFNAAYPGKKRLFEDENYLIFQL